MHAKGLAGGFLVLVLAACGAPAPLVQEASTAHAEPRSLTVFAAASLTDAFLEIGRDFETSIPGVTVQFNFAGSQALRTQLEQGAAADIFASASWSEMDALTRSAMVEANTARVFLTNRLVIILPGDNPAGIRTLEDLARPGVKLLLAAEEVPAGRYARQVLQDLDAIYGPGYREAVLGNAVSNEQNVRQVVTKVLLGEADAGIVYLSDAVSEPALLTLAIPDEYNMIAEYPIAVLAGTESPTLAGAFIQFLLSVEVQAKLKAWGFLPIQP
jgi:molybdate transport system substrate-binding protein